MAYGTQPAYSFLAVICGLSRANEKDIQRAWDAVKPAMRPRIHTFIATSPIHMESKLNKTPDEVVAIAVKAVSFAKSLGCDDIEFSPEDAGRSDPEFLVRILGEVIKAGATTLNIPDTTGWNMPWEFGGLIKRLKDTVPGAEGKVIFSTHCQNDLGLSTANSLAGAMNGARQIECTINGIGERAGNAALEEVVMGIALKGDEHLGPCNLYTAINPIHITGASKMVSEYTGMMCQPHKAIVGVNAFQHESGIHQDGMIKNKVSRGWCEQRDAMNERHEQFRTRNVGACRAERPAQNALRGSESRRTAASECSTSDRNVLRAARMCYEQPECATSSQHAVFALKRALASLTPHSPPLSPFQGTYEIMTPESIGLMRGESQSGAGIVLGKHSGRNAVKTRLEEMGYTLDLDKLNAVFARFKEVAEKKKGGLEDDDLEALVSDTAYNTDVYWTLKDLTVTTGMSGIPTATVTMQGPDGVIRYVACTGTGPVDAVYKAIDKLIGLKVQLNSYGMQAVNEGIDALATTRVSISPVEEGTVSSVSLHASGETKTRKFSGSGSDGDIVVASARAYVGAMNKLLAWNMRRSQIGGEKGDKKAEEKVEHRG